MIELTWTPAHFNAKDGTRVEYLKLVIYESCGVKIAINRYKKNTRFVTEREDVIGDIPYFVDIEDAPISCLIIRYWGEEPNWQFDLFPETRVLEFLRRIKDDVEIMEQLDRRLEYEAWQEFKYLIEEVEFDQIMLKG